MARPASCHLGQSRIRLLRCLPLSLCLLLLLNEFVERSGQSTKALQHTECLVLAEGWPSWHGHLAWVDTWQRSRQLSLDAWLSHICSSAGFRTALLHASLDTAEAAVTVADAQAVGEGVMAGRG